MLVKKDTSNKVLDYINTWGETLAYISWAIRASYHHTLKSMPGLSIFGRDMIFNITSIIYWQVINDKN